MGIAGPTSDDVKAHAGQTVDEILNWGAKGGIEYFITFYPLYLQLWPMGRSLEDIEARYDEQRGMDLKKLAGTHDALSTALGEAQTQQYTQQNCSIRLQQVWSGGATSNTAHQMTSEQVRLAGNDIESAQAAVKAIAGFIDAARSAVTGKAVNVRNMADFDGDNPKLKIDGRSTDDIEEMIDIRNAKEWISNDQANDVCIWFPERNIDTSDRYALLGHNPVNKPGGLGHDIQVVVNYWLDHVFKPDVEGKLGILDTVCNEADGDINAAYKLVTDALNAVHDTRYPRPATQANQPSQSVSTSSPGPGPSTPGTGTGSGTDSSGSGTGTSGSGLSTSLTGTSGTSTVTSAFNALASGMTGLGTLVQTAESAVSQVSGLGSTFASLSQSVTQGLGSLTTQVQQGLDGILGTHNANSNISGTTGKPVAEFDVAGKQLKLEQGKNGALELVLADSDGKGKSYTLGLDEHGVPVITSQDESGTGNSTSDASPSSSAHHSSTDKKPGDQSPGAQKPTDQSTGNQGTAPVPPKSTTQSPPQFDSGAELAESGPL